MDRKEISKEELTMAVSDYPIWIIRGIPVDFWLKYADTIGAFVKENKLKPVEQGNFVTKGDLAFANLMKGEMATPAVTQKAAAYVPRIINPRGGLKIPHLHYNGETYILNAAQWQKFSGLIVKDFQAKISKAGAVNFDQLLDISEGMNSLV
jgi:hypothetical protein